MKNSLPLGFALLLLLLAGNYYFSNRTFRLLQEDQQRLAESQGMRIEALSLLNIYLDAETGQRGYLLTGDEAYLAPFTKAKYTLEHGGERLATVAAKAAAVEDLRKRLRPSEQGKFEELERTIRLQKEQGNSAALDEVKKGMGKELMNALHREIDTIDAEQRSQAMAMLAAAESRRNTASLFGTVATLTLGAALCGIYVITNRHFVERERLLTIANEAKGTLQKALASERAAHSEATHANKLKDEFIAVVSHELRTPLNAILGWTSLLREGPEDEKELQEGLDAIDRNSRAQARLVDDLLDISRIMTGKVRLQIAEVNLRAIVVSVVDGLRPAANARGVTVQVTGTDEPTEVLGDSDRLQQIFWNLLMNSIKFTPRGGRVEVAMENFDSRVAVEVRDSGQGIKADFLPRIFDRFSQQDTATTRGQAGLGLGLAITRHLVELHGGRIIASSPGEGKGATFRVEIPVVAVRELKAQLSHRQVQHLNGAPATVAMQSVVLNGLRILAVDDQQDTLTVIHRVLNRAGAEVRTATSVAEAMITLTGWRPDLLISDIGMPGTDGYSFVRGLRAHPDPELRNLRAVALTAFAREQDRAEAIEAGFNDHLAKPVDSALLLNKVAEMGGRI